jgi:hypothetical protein
MKNYIILIAIFITGSSSCNSIIKKEDVDGFLIFSKDVTLNKSNIYQIVEEAKKYLYLFNISSDNDLGYFVDSERKEEVALISCEPSIQYFYTRSDTVCIGLYFTLKGKVVVPKQSANLEFHFVGNEFVTIGNHGKYLEFDSPQQRKDVIQAQTVFFEDYVLNNMYEFSNWFKKRE